MYVELYILHNYLHVGVLFFAVYKGNDNYWGDVVRLDY